MLSILIPTYNYNAFSLVEELNNQALATGIKYEIIVLDDGSNYFLKENQKINELDNCSLNELSQNIGYSKIRNVLAKKAKYDWLLFLDSDTFPRSSSYISNYIKLITKNKKVVFGGIEYPKNKPENDKLLRWKYGKKREVSSLSNRIKKPYNSVFVYNFLIEKTIFSSILFDEKIKKYGYEDFMFIQNLKLKNINIYHCENTVFHLNSDTSDVFLTKTRTALKTLQFLFENQNIFYIETKITKTYNILYRLKLVATISRLFQKHQNKLETNLKSKKPSLFILDLYKIGYFCLINTK
ncbi:glycosyltransferase [Flavobacterium psychrophilum]|uniref:Glycosyl transferase, group 2 family protein n=5 Tax=Flavobacterium psychrophilum TaxID=96345 RepID=A6H0Q3_FLAPJ|nr:glycosyltransferase [Flavobacterium psychrophilum]AIG30611.1 hypothetical protein IA03_09070 [Flavobacterium psychrophilum]AIG32886.1 hypothetical protein IA01_09100 [Flavobacterium psychrophilum]AIG35041.1 hypothetical protein IA02_08485 [Flavobacterium psychrophilum]AIG37406.1 hypothetical protein IA04_09005 [Flavobacterium psychrophilum]AIG39670.1 hypothetical protein IA05_09080 [Flavobacterium psychrophilum]